MNDMKKTKMNKHPVLLAKRETTKKVLGKTLG